MKSIKTSIEWWQNFPSQFITKETLLSLSHSFTESYPHLSKNHLYHLVAEVVRFIYSEFSSYRRRREEKQVELIEILQDIIEKGSVFEYAQCKSDNIEYLSRFNAHDEAMLNWLFAQAVGPSANKLAKPRHITSYAIVTKPLTKNITLWFFINFYNFLITQPLLSETQQKVADKLSFCIERWREYPALPIRCTNPGIDASGKANGMSESPFSPPAVDGDSFCPDRTVCADDLTPAAIGSSSARALRFPASSTEKKVQFTLSSSEKLPDKLSSTADKENLVPIASNKPEKPKAQKWFKLF